MYNGVDASITMKAEAVEAVLFEHNLRVRK